MQTDLNKLIAEIMPGTALAKSPDGQEAAREADMAKLVMQEQHNFPLTFAEMSVLLQAMDTFVPKVMATALSTTLRPDLTPEQRANALSFMKSQTEVGAELYKRLITAARTLRDEFRKKHPTTDPMTDPNFAADREMIQKVYGFGEQK